MLLRIMAKHPRLMTCLALVVIAIMLPLFIRRQIVVWNGAKDGGLLWVLLAGYILIALAELIILFFTRKYNQRRRESTQDSKHGTQYCACDIISSETQKSKN